MNKSEAKRKNMMEACLADKVTDREDIDPNHYIFINHHHYTPLTQGGWNNILRRYFNQLGIEVDKEHKKHNLNHRFRHGYAMKLISLGYNEVQVAEMLRHSGTETVKRYFNPTRKDKIVMLNKQKTALQARRATIEE
jgi:integrase/recombinase XerD